MAKVRPAVPPSRNREDPSTEPLWSTYDLARRLNKTPNAVSIMRYKGDGPPALRLGRQVRYRPADVERWLDERREAS